jgi:hypothetical protein
VKRAIVVAISVILALVVAAPIASGQSSSQSQNLGKGQKFSTPDRRLVELDGLNRPQPGGW